MKLNTCLVGGLAVVGLLGFGAAKGRAQMMFFEVDRAVPDGNPAGLADVRTLGGIAPGLPFTVGLSIRGRDEDGMLSGDLYVTLSHEGVGGEVDAMVVLLNRPGRRVEDGEGYKDNGLAVTFSADGDLPDVHNYRLVLNGDHGIPLGGPLTGMWSPDGRSTDPDGVLDTDPRDTDLASFFALETYDGKWTLFVADLMPGGTAQLESWSLTFVPEPSRVALMFGAGLLVLAGLRRRGRG
ncbi:MAG: PEP-CTERM sorting domain-containing protein [Verrucomicrobiae bacterium]|nr:PEP-CTERM sorting domain-containing protein [Verrucomicrobiae bacterium]